MYITRSVWKVTGLSERNAFGIYCIFSNDFIYTSLTGGSFSYEHWRTDNEHQVTNKPKHVLVPLFQTLEMFRHMFGDITMVHTHARMFFLGKKDQIGAGRNERCLQEQNTLNEQSSVQSRVDKQVVCGNHWHPKSKIKFILIIFFFTWDIVHSEFLP